MTTSVRTTAITAYLNGVELVGAARPLSAQCTFGFDQRTSTAVIRLGQLPDSARPPLPLRTRVRLDMDASPATAGPRAGAVARTTRFFGYLVELDYALYPRSIDLVCRGPLVRAELYSYDGVAGAGPTATGYDLARGGIGDTDENMVRNVLQYVGLWCPGTTGAPASLDFEVHIGEADGTHPDTYPNCGTGQTLGTTNPEQFEWTVGETALSYIDKLDSISFPDTPQLSGKPPFAYRTYESLAGTIVRTKIATYADSTPVATFREGVDIFDGSGQQQALQINNRVAVTGYNTGGAGIVPKFKSLQQTNPLLAGYQTLQVSSGMIERSNIADSGTGLSCEAVAAGLLSANNRELYKYTLTTPRAYADDGVSPISPGQTIQILPSVATSPKGRLFADGDFGLYYVQNVQSAVDEQGVYTTTLVVLGGPSSLGRVVAPPGVDFSMSAETELVVVAGVETTLYTIHCIASKTDGNSSITTYAWTTTGSCTPASGSLDTFTTTFTSLVGVTITLSVLDSAGLAGAVTHTPPAVTASNYLVRKLYLAGTDTIDDYSPAGWAVHSQTAATVTTNGPLWADGTAVLASTDDLATAPSSTTPFASGTVTALWVETNINASALLAGSSAGHIAYSVGGGAWVDKGPVPDGNPILKCAISAYYPAQWFALTGAHLYRTDNAGGGWVVVQAAAGGETFLDWVISVKRGMIAMSGGRLLIDLNGVTQTFPISMAGIDIRAVTADIRADRFYCATSVQYTFMHANAGDTALVQMTDLPAPIPVRGLWRDGHARGLLYIAAGTNGAYKSLDGFGSSAGYYQIRKPGVGSSPGGANYTQIGADGLLVAAPVTTATFVSSTAALCLDLYNATTHADDPEPAGWQFPSFDDSAWVNAVAANVIGPDAPVAGSTPLWPTLNPNADADTNGATNSALFRVHGTLSGGVPSSAQITFIADSTLDVWVNGVFIAHFDYYDAGGTTMAGVSPVTVPVDPALFVEGDNVIAFLGRNRLPGGPIPPANDAAWVSYKIVVT